MDKYIVVQLLGHRIVLFLIFWGTSIPFFKGAAPVCIPTNSAKMFPFFHIHTNICVASWVVNFSHSDRCEVISHCGFDLHFHQQCSECSLFSISSPTSLVFCVVNFSRSDRCEVISHCTFDLYFPDANVFPRCADILREFAFAFKSIPVTWDEHVLNVPSACVGNIHFNTFNKMSHWYISDSASNPNKLFSNPNKLFSPLNVLQFLQWWNVSARFLPAESDVVSTEHSVKGQKQDISQKCV